MISFTLANILSKLTKFGRHVFAARRESFLHKLTNACPYGRHNDQWDVQG